MLTASRRVFGIYKPNKRLQEVSSECHLEEINIVQPAFVGSDRVRSVVVGEDEEDVGAFGLGLIDIDRSGRGVGARSGNEDEYEKA